MTPTSTSYTPPGELTGCMNDANCTQNTLNPSELNLWRVIKKNDDGTIEMVSEYVSSKTVSFYGKTGFINLVGGLNTIAAQYTNSKYVQNTRHIGYSNQTEKLTDTSALIKTEPSWEKNTIHETGWSDCDRNLYLCGVDESLGAGDIGFEIDYNLVNTACGSMIAKNQSDLETSYWIASRLSSYGNESFWGFGATRVLPSGARYWASLYDYKNNFINYESSYAVRPILTVKYDVLLASGDGKSVDTAYTLE